MDLSRIPIIGRQNSDQEQWYYHTDYSADVRQIKPELRVFLRQRGLQVNWVVVDRDPQGADYITLTVQNPNGSYRPFDGRVLEALRKNIQRGPDYRKMLAEIEAAEAKKARADEQRDLEIAEGVADDLRYAGHVITPSVASRERSKKVSRGRTESDNADSPSPQGNP